MLAFTALMAALANVLSFPPLALPVTPEVTVHFSQLPIFIAGILTGPVGGLIAGAVGGLYMSFARIPFIIGGLAILGLASGFFGKRVRPLYAGILAWLVQAPYVIVTDYVWFTIFSERTSQASWALIASILTVLTIEAVISAALTEVVVHYLKRTRITWQMTDA
jgi:riboflavin transporter FmnP